MNGDGHVKIGAIGMQQTSMAALLVMNVKTCPKERADDLSWFEDRQSRRHEC